MQSLRVVYMFLTHGVFTALSQEVKVCSFLLVAFGTFGASHFQDGVLNQSWWQRSREAYPGVPWQHWHQGWSRRRARKGPQSAGLVHKHPSCRTQPVFAGWRWPPRKCSSLSIREVTGVRVMPTQNPKSEGSARHRTLLPPEISQSKHCEAFSFLWWHFWKRVMGHAFPDLHRLTVILRSGAHMLLCGRASTTSVWESATPNFPSEVTLAREE